MWVMKQWVIWSHLPLSPLPIRHSPIVKFFSGWMWKHLNPFKMSAAGSLLHGKHTYSSTVADGSRVRIPTNYKKNNMMDESQTTWKVKKWIADIKKVTKKSMHFYLVYFKVLIRCTDKTSYAKTSHRRKVLIHKVLRTKGPTPKRPTDKTSYFKTSQRQNVLRQNVPQTKGPHT